MDVAVEIGKKLLSAVVQLITHPFYYVGILFVILQYRRQIMFERKLFSVKLHSIVPETWRAVLWGLVGGLCASVVLAFVGATLQPEALLLLWVISLLLVFVRVRYLCLAYAVGVIGILQTVLIWVPQLQTVEPLKWLVNVLLSVDMPPLLALVAVLHLLEALLVRLQGARSGSPMFYESKRGKIVGGYQLQGFWPVPLFLVVPLQGGGMELPWQPLLGGELWQYGWAVAGFPFMLGFAERTVTRLPQDKVRWSSTLLIAYALLVFLGALAAEWMSVLTIAASLLCIGLHEAMLALSRMDEADRSPYFVHNRKGLMILAVLPDSAAEQLGLKTGEIIHKVNGFPVLSKQDLHFAMRQNSAFCKLEVLNLDGQSKFLQKPLYAGEHHQLGIVLAPDQDALYFAEERPPGIIAYVRRKLVGLISKQPPSHSA
ncbi:PDZ domain-containing protein [Paenibacillus hamazuiensis]|uniref:PDZ domain-containing protein n=1 Tax=Paenibacillus hamazuiensis TaxID=2936508 RepID=UPI00200FB5C5|nr:PDZ domain-containing protein [Paenibacillus hamazuiensis]